MSVLIAKILGRSCQICLHLSGGFMGTWLYATYRNKPAILSDDFLGVSLVLFGMTAALAITAILMWALIEEKPARSP